MEDITPTPQASGTAATATAAPGTVAKATSTATKASAATSASAATTAKRPMEASAAAAPAPVKKVMAATGTKSSALQQQIQQQLQEQLQQQLAAAAARGQQAHITPAHIQAQAAAMVQAAAQAQAVVAAAKARAPNGQLQPMTAAQVAALSQIQAAAIVNSRKVTPAADGTTTTPSPAQIQAQIQMQAQALVHAHTQALMQSGVYKGDVSPRAGAASTASNSTTAAPKGSSTVGAATAPTKNATSSASAWLSQSQQQPKLTPAQAQQVQELKTAHAAERAACATAEQQAALEPAFQAKLKALYEQFRRQATTPSSALAAPPRVPNPTAGVVPNPVSNSSAMSVVAAPKSLLDSSSGGGAGGDTSNNSIVGFDGSAHMGDQNSTMMGPDGTLLNMSMTTSPAAFQQQMAAALQEFWVSAHHQIDGLMDQTEHDFKNHNDLPLARIKRIMKSDEDVRMIAAEAPVLLAKACELFILDLSIRAWNYSQWHKRRTLQKEDVKEAIQKTDIFDFLVDVIP
jgi:nuclear transcription factor Y, gamma